jgi:beta-glucosidase
MVMQTQPTDGDTALSLLARLSLEEKVRLLTGSGHWAFPGNVEIGLRPTIVSDGPAGARGIQFDTRRPASSLPAPIGLGATWDVNLVRELAVALGHEARSRGIDLLLAPDLNLVRTPLGGRAFEFFSEDPWLTAGMATAYVAGVQETGVATCIKHFVANDSETERKSYDARISEPVLRELYLLPFEMCIEAAHPYTVMAAYNSVNGFRMTENRRLLREVLKDEWGFDGVVVSDWTATFATEAPALAGLDVVMPGPDGPWGARLVAAVAAGRVPEAVIDDKVLRLLRLAARTGALGAAGPQPGSGAGEAAPIRTVEPALLRRAAARSFVLLSNRDAMLPLNGAARRRIALVGPCAVWPRTQGGGSAVVLAAESPSLVDALRAELGDQGEVELATGCRPLGPVPLPARGTIRDPLSGELGLRLEARAADGAPIHDALFPRSTVTWWDDVPDAVHALAATIVLWGRYRAEVAGPHLIGAAGLGRVAVEVDGERLAEATTLPPPELIGVVARPPELRVPVRLEAGQEIDVRVINELPVHLESGREIEVRGAERPAVRLRGSGLVLVRLGIAAAPDEDAMLAEAEEAARRSTACVVVVGLGEDGDSEGFDRDSLMLPGRQDELVRRVAAANPNTAVVVNAGSPALLPWADSVGAVLQTWLPGQAMSEALADVLLGNAEPGGRLPVSLPRRQEDCPALVAEPHYGALEYSEGLLLGYRGYDRSGIEPHFCFGHGLGYTEWEYRSLEPARTALQGGDDLEVSVVVRNAGSRPGREVVQLYLEDGGAGADADGESADGGSPERPVRILAAFAVVGAEPGEEAKATLTVPARAFARYDQSVPGWIWPAGVRRLRVGRSSRDIRLSASVKVVTG